MGLKFLFIAFAIAFIIALLIHANKPKDKDVQYNEPAKQPKQHPKQQIPKIKPYRKLEKKMQRKAGKRAVANKNASEYIPDNTSTEKVLLSELLNYGSLIDKNTFDDLIDMQLDGAKYVNIPSRTLLELNRRKKANAIESDKLSSCAARNNKGMEYEKDGDIDSAINIYEENILDGYPAHHSYKRLMVLYHKQKDYENEIRVIERALEVFGNYPEYNDRLIKVNKLIE